VRTVRTRLRVVGAVGIIAVIGRMRRLRVGVITEAAVVIGT